jgi:hypothetical protein
VPDELSRAAERSLAMGGYQLLSIIGAIVVIIVVLKVLGLY